MVVKDLMSRIIMISYGTLLIWLLIFLDFTNAQNEILEFTIKDGEIEIHLKLKRTEQLLANEHMPVWTVKSRKRNYCQREHHLSHQLWPNFLEDRVGDFIFYQDQDKSSAVVLFRRTNTLVGLIDTRYRIVGLPLHECGSVVEVGGPYVEHNECPSMNPESHLKALDLSMPRNEEASTQHNDPPPTVDDDSVTSLYPEIMVFISHDVTKVVKNRHPDAYLDLIVAQYLIFFNVVDMLISKLSIDNIKIHLNLAGIVIEDQENAFQFLMIHHEDEGVPYFDADRVFRHFLHYGMLNHYVFPQDSFDFFFISTRNSLWSDEIHNHVGGLSWPSETYKERQTRRFSRFWSGAIIEYTCGFEYVVAAHEIAHLMAIKHDPKDKGFCSRYTQCYAIMQEISVHCQDCFKWSDESYENLKEFARDNPDRCYLLNKPRSLYPYNSRMKTFTSSEQCRCYGFGPSMLINENEGRDAIPRGKCGRSLFCGGLPEGLVLPLPIDGTPCSKNGLCWNNICRMNENIEN